MAVVHVIGGGPAGTIAAIHAAEKHDVILSEEHQVIGIPTNCSGLFSKEGLESFSDFLDYGSIIENKIYGANIHFGNEIITVERKDPIAYACKRDLLDQKLADLAEKKGVKIEYGKRISTNYYSDIIIGADGPVSSVAKNFNFPKIERFCLTMQKEIPYKTDGRLVEVFLSNEKFPGFFGWIIPRNEEYAEIAAGVILPNDVRRAWDSLVKMIGIEKQEDVKTALIPIKTRPRSGKTIGKRKVLLVGDAAGQTKATTGGGVIFGGKCARLAGKFCDNPSRYEFEWKIRYGFDLFLHEKIQEFVGYKTDEEIEELGKKLKRMDMERFLSKRGDMDSPSKMIKPELLIHLLKGTI